MAFERHPPLHGISNVNNQVQVPERAFEDRLSAMLDSTLGIVLAVLVFAMMLLTFVDVFGRSGFDRPVPAGFEITELMMAFTVYLGLPVVSARREHITIGLLDHLFKANVKRAQQFLINLIMGLVTLVWAREIWIQGNSLAGANELLMFLQIGKAPFVYAMSILTIVAAVIFLLLAWRKLTEPSLEK